MMLEKFAEKGSVKAYPSGAKKEEHGGDLLAFLLFSSPLLMAACHGIMQDMQPPEVKEAKQTYQTTEARMDAEHKAEYERLRKEWNKAYQEYVEQHKEEIAFLKDAAKGKVSDEALKGAIAGTVMTGGSLSGGIQGALISAVFGNAEGFTKGAVVGGLLTGHPIAGGVIGAVFGDSPEKKMNSKINEAIYNELIKAGHIDPYKYDRDYRWMSDNAKRARVEAEIEREKAGKAGKSVQPETHKRGVNETLQQKLDFMTEDDMDHFSYPLNAETAKKAAPEPVMAPQAKQEALPMVLMAKQNSR